MRRKWRPDRWPLPAGLAFVSRPTRKSLISERFEFGARRAAAARAARPEERPINHYQFLSLIYLLRVLLGPRPRSWCSLRRTQPRTQIGSDEPHAGPSRRPTWPGAHLHRPPVSQLRGRRFDSDPSSGSGPPERLAGLQPTSNALNVGAGGRPIWDFRRAKSAKVGPKQTVGRRCAIAGDISSTFANHLVFGSR